LFLRATTTPVVAATVETVATATVGKAPSVKLTGRVGNTATGPEGEMGATGASFLHSRAARTTSGSYSGVRWSLSTISR
jgi:hypothetical protein